MNRTVLLAIVAALIAAARTRLTGTVLGQQISIPVLWVIAAAVVLAIAAAVLYLVRSITRDLAPLLRPWTAS